MKHTDGKFKGVRGANIYYQGWIPDGEVKAVLFLVHGLGEHCCRIFAIINWFQIPPNFQLGHFRAGSHRGGYHPDFLNNPIVAQTHPKLIPLFIIA